MRPANRVRARHAGTIASPVVEILGFRNNNEQMTLSAVEVFSLFTIGGWYLEGGA
jgi:hypothetical protein